MIDLHMHTTYSDGSKTVAEVLTMCEQRKLEYISITDHNHCGAYDEEVLKNNKIFSGIIIKGCELNAEFQSQSIELLAYHINPDEIMVWKEKYYSRDKRMQTNKEIYERFLNILDKKGIIYNKSEIRPTKNEDEYIERPIWEEIVKHPENKAIIGEDSFKNLGVFYRKELTNPKSEYFLNRVGSFPKAKEVIDTIHQFGGIVFLAHPFEYKLENIRPFLDDLRAETTLDGIECFHPSANEEERKWLVDYARKNKLYITGGSDYHGAAKPDIEIGVGRGDLNISKDWVKDWIERR